ncbi:OsmC family protein [Roseicella aquatilis]|uniref:OsmC family peroxiredoxin n=1 Tax=Roseicella aquatilis TaxID=2527868 RepID=A0A4R4DB76_9PROT|nr:OsmC family protein [Roseicella aquatilis]TCZ57147.1 OsmC family peroxiredoxin [Roseicella aquatilis]
MASIRRSATAQWQGTGKDGKGALTTQSGTLRETPYGFNARFGEGQGTNPEELIAAAHAGCFTMALAFKLQGAGLTPESLSTEARLSMEQEGGGWTIKAVALTLKAKVPGATPEQFQPLAADAKATCPVSRVLNADITLDATLE